MGNGPNVLPHAAILDDSRRKGRKGGGGVHGRQGRQSHDSFHYFRSRILLKLAIVSSEGVPVSLFTPLFLGCPVCNAGKSSHSASATSAHRVVSPGILIGYQCGHQFTLYDALKEDVNGGVFGVLTVFSHWQWTQQLTIESGKIASIPLVPPSDVTPFTALLTQHASGKDQDTIVIPSVLSLKTDELLISAPGHLGAPAEALGAPVSMSAFVYGYRSIPESGWKRLFYESLTDFSEHRHSPSIFKLATSIEICADRTYDAYLKHHGLPDADRKRIVPARHWDTRAGRIKDMAGAMLDAQAASRLTSSLPQFKKDVREPRNAFAHDFAPAASHDENSGAYRSAFDILWALDLLREKLP